jgi:hypothetical protein
MSVMGMEFPYGTSRQFCRPALATLSRPRHSTWDSDGCRAFGRRHYRDRLRCEDSKKSRSPHGDMEIEGLTPLPSPQISAVARGTFLWPTGSVALRASWASLRRFYAGWQVSRSECEIVARYRPAPRESPIKYIFVISARSGSRQSWPFPRHFSCDERSMNRHRRKGTPDTRYVTTQRF